MDIETDLERIEKLAKKMERENWEFRSFLKSQFPSKRLDAIVHRHLEDVLSGIDCTACANCCRTVPIRVDEEDVAALAAARGTPLEQFVAEYTEAGEDARFIKGQPCPFLDGNRCSCYAARPKTCRSYPHLHGDDIMSRIMSVIENCAVCPIVFNVFERVKQDIRSRRNRHKGQFRH